MRDGAGASAGSAPVGRRTVLGAAALGIATHALPAAAVAASGGGGGSQATAATVDTVSDGITPTVITAGGVDYDLYAFPYSGTDATKTYTFTPATAGEVEVLLVAGGASGGKDRGGGGGAGGVVATIDLEAAGGPTAAGITVSLAASAYTIAVGKGGAARGSSAGGEDGQPSSITGDGVGLTAIGGGGGANWGNDGRDGGSGGGGALADRVYVPGGGEPSQGYGGGTPGANQAMGAGGGGAGGVGGNPSGTTTVNPVGGAGGQGVDIRPFLGNLDVAGDTSGPVPVAGGGGGYGQTFSRGGVGGAGGSGVGGRGAVNDGLGATAGVTGTGSGGGGSGSSTSGAGGSGIVYVRVRRP